MRRRVVITGIGMVNPLGHDVQSVWSALKESKSGVGPITVFDPAGYPTTIAAEVKNAQKIVPRAMLLGILVVCLAYLTINFAYLKLLPLSKIINSESVASDAINTFWVAGSKFIAFLIVLSVLGTIGIYILTAPQNVLMASDATLPEVMILLRGSNLR